MSLKIEKKNTETLALVGRLDTVTAPELEAEISAILPTVESLVLDMEKLEYFFRRTACHSQNAKGFDAKSGTKAYKCFG